MRRALVVAAIAVAGPAHADRLRDRWQGGAWLHYEVTEVRAVGDPMNPAVRGDDLVLAAARERSVGREIELEEAR